MNLPCDKLVVSKICWSSFRFGHTRFHDLLQILSLFSHLSFLSNVFILQPDLSYLYFLKFPNLKVFKERITAEFLLTLNVNLFLIIFWFKGRETTNIKQDQELVSGLGTWKNWWCQRSTGTVPMWRADQCYRDVCPFWPMMGESLYPI